MIPDWDLRLRGFILAPRPSEELTVLRFVFLRVHLFELIFNVTEGDLCSLFRDEFRDRPTRNFREYDFAIARHRFVRAL